MVMVIFQQQSLWTKLSRMASTKTDFSAGSLHVVGAHNFATTTGLTGNLFDKI